MGGWSGLGFFFFYSSLDSSRVETNCSNIRKYLNIAEPNEYFPWFE